MHLYASRISYTSSFAEKKVWCPSDDIKYVIFHPISFTVNVFPHFFCARCKKSRGHVAYLLTPNHPTSCTTSCVMGSVRRKISQTHAPTCKRVIYVSVGGRKRKKKRENKWGRKEKRHTHERRKAEVRKVPARLRLQTYAGLVRTARLSPRMAGLGTRSRQVASSLVPSASPFKKGGGFVTKCDH